ncbi:MAG: hypothetical protein QNJ78_04850 [Gammaproteobacteria bacterium]|nr:hypothetical protein [Gammaproteobacteria bacterium]
MSTQWLTTTAARMIDLEEGAGFLRDLLKIDEHRMEFTEFDLDGAIEVIRQLMATPSQELLEKLKAIVPDLDELRERAEQLLADEIPEEFQFLFMTFDALRLQPEARTEYSWPLFDRQTSDEDLFADKLLLRLNAGFSLNQTIQPLAELPKGMLLDPQRSEVLRMAMQGSLALGQSLAGGSAPVSLQMASTVSADAGLQLFYRHYSGHRVGEALLFDLRRLASPFSIDALKRGFFQGNLAAVKFKVAHSADVSGRIGFAQDLQLSQLVKGEFGLTFGFKKSLAGEFEYLIYPTGDGKRMALKLRRLSAHTQERSSSLGLQLDLSDWAAKVYPMIEDKLGEAQTILNRVKGVIPGQDLFRKTLGDALAKALHDFDDKAQVLEGLGFSAEGQLGETFKGVLLNEIEASRRLWRGDLEERSQEITAEILNRLPVGVDVRNQLEGKLREALHKGLGELRETLDEQLKSLVTGSAFSATVEKLNKLGYSIDKRIRKTEKRIEAVGQAVRKELDRVQLRLNELKNRFTDASKAKIAMGVESLSKEAGSKDLNLSLVLDPHHADAQSLLRSLLLADLDELSAQLRSWQDAAQNSAIISAAGTLTHYTRLTEETGFACVLFGNGFSGKTRIDAQASLVVDAHGNIQCLSQMEFNKLYKGMHDERELQIVDAVELATARSTNSLSMAMNLSLTDEDLTPAEALAFFRSAEQVGLLEPGTAEQAVSALNATNLKSGRLDVGMTMSKSQLLRLLQIEDTGRELAEQPLDGERIFRIASEQMASICTLQPPSQSLLETLKKLREELPGFGVPVGGNLREMILGMTRERFTQSEKWLEHMYGEQPSDNLQASNALSWVRARHVAVLGCHGECMGERREALPEVLQPEPDFGDTQNRQLGLLDALQDMREAYYWDLDRGLEALRRQQSHIGQGIKSWFVWQADFPRWWMLNSKEIRPLTLAFFKTIAQLAGTEDLAGPPMLSAALTLKGQQGADKQRIALM